MLILRLLHVFCGHIDTSLVVVHEMTRCRSKCSRRLVVWVPSEGSVIGSKVATFNMDCFVTFVVFDEFLGCVNPCFFGASCVCFDEPGKNMGDDKGVVGGEFGNVDGVMCHTRAIGLIYEFVDKATFFLEHE